MCVKGESNPQLNLGRVPCYHYTINAVLKVEKHCSKYCTYKGEERKDDRTQRNNNATRGTKRFLEDILISLCRTLNRIVSIESSSGIIFEYSIPCKVLEFVIVRYLIDILISQRFQLGQWLTSVTSWTALQTSSGDLERESQIASHDLFQAEAQGPLTSLKTLTHLTEVPSMQTGNRSVGLAHLQIVAAHLLRNIID